jgi:hypothetical protein
MRIRKMKRKSPILLNIFLLLTAITFVGLERQGFAEETRKSVAYLDELSLNEKVEAEDLLLRYLDAQSVGDTGSIEKMLGGHLLKKRKRLLNNPSYPDFLRRTYKNARLQIIDYKRLQKNTIQVETIIFLNEQESIHVNFILVKESLQSNSGLSYRIYSEKVINP